MGHESRARCSAQPYWLAKPWEACAAVPRACGAANKVKGGNALKERSTAGGGRAFLAALVSVPIFFFIEFSSVLSSVLTYLRGRAALALERAQDELCSQGRGGGTHCWTFTLLFLFLSPNVLSSRFCAAAHARALHCRPGRHTRKV